MAESTAPECTAGLGPPRNSTSCTGPHPEQNCHHWLRGDLHGQHSWQHLHTLETTQVISLAHDWLIISIQKKTNNPSNNGFYKSLQNEYIFNTHSWLQNRREKWEGEKFPKPHDICISCQLLTIYPQIRLFSGQRMSCCTKWTCKCRNNPQTGPTGQKMYRCPTLSGLWGQIGKPPNFLGALPWPNTLNMPNSDDTRQKLAPLR